ncbi:TPA: MipA/OmpV family protein [Kluyvera ascorbata]|uniref:MipA/OmpV family protein n=1 Tax=Kluyvera genomosp. 2 TaxID=2774054 RepID=A0A2T2Y5N7_9ENTR|nr:MULTISPECIES: MipA/OmpV family protein [Enterobacteriaceae]HAT3917125.1 MipA/OmpV family protein [Kluyvera ascorbata]PSR47847.1 MipA/OmpV family protein [Kluyvera genomosp. 2]BBQ81803.1 membrane protein [Klebsiella sp. WP3-W18-ESBL-02]BBR18806.1 membrane protein [Klebsiella sp. WP3-S18-ESBL-05]BBT68997.1 membrane protein [Klebsiella sp. WP8-S18-ESBL-06]
MSIKHSALLLLLAPFMSNVVASELSVGAGVIYNESPWRGYNENTHAVPIVNYEGDSFYIRQTTLGYALFKTPRDEVSLTASWMPLTFDPSDNDDSAMKQLDKRHSTAMAGMAWYHHEKWGSLKLSAAADVLDNSDGWVGELSWFRVLPVGKLSVIPAAGVYYYDDRFNRYYYGVSGAESRRSGLATWSPAESWMPYVGLTVKYPLTRSLILMANATYSVLPNEIKNSPMVDRDDSFTLLTGINWRF